MSTSLFSAWKKNLFSSPFRAKCLANEENEETVAESERTIAAAATESESSSSEEAPPSVEVEAPPSVEVEAPPSVEVEAPPSVEVEAPPSVEVEAPPSADVVEALPSASAVDALPGTAVDAPPSADAAEAPPGDGVVKESALPIMSYVTNAHIAATACARFCIDQLTNPKESPPKEPVEEKEYSCEYGDAKYYALCAFGGLLSCGLTHTAVVPLDMVKCRIQVNPAKYKGIINGFRVTMAEEGTRALAKGWAPTFFGYSMQGVGKFGFYEAFKILYGNMLGEENSYLWRTSLYLAASASAEFFADIALCPMEAVKVRIQTQPGWSTTLREGAPRIFKEEGLMGFYKGLVPLWARQIPYTMMKFACFERTVEALYKYVVPKPRSECSKPEQLVVTFAAGYIAGVFCAVVSHPADTIVSKLNQAKGSNFVQVAKNLGFMGMWKGLFPRIIMIGTLTALQWFIYDSVKVAFRLPRPPPPEMPESLKKRLECEEDD